LLSQPETYQTILKRSAGIYQACKDTVQLNDILGIERMDKSSFEYRAACFRHSSRNGFFSTPHQSALAKSLYARLEADPGYRKFSAGKNNDAVLGFWKNEHYSTMSILPLLKKLQADGLSIHALYGKDDGLFSTEQVNDLRGIIGKTHLQYVKDASHYLYTDQQPAFIAALADWLR
jgi:proline iminopeptidase